MPFVFCPAIFTISSETFLAGSESSTITARSRDDGGKDGKALNFSADFLRPATSGRKEISPAHTVLSIPRPRRCATETAPNLTLKPSRFSEPQPAANPASQTGSPSTCEKFSRPASTPRIESRSHTSRLAA